jgi:bifunctional DNA-binding transcriptional regulator/antitoxin component of YhaV-PrlF toxin-antitoxin module
MRIAPKGQVTIPRTIREKTGLLPHSEVGFLYDGRTVRIVRGRARKADRGRMIVERLRGSARKIRFSTDEIMKLMRDS